MIAAALVHPTEGEMQHMMLHGMSRCADLPLSCRVLQAAVHVGATSILRL
jgi:hypothetical protein